MTSSSEYPTRALVLGGGGIAGIAWQTGLVVALAEQGIALAETDVVVGTSAGSVVGAQVLGGDIAALYAALREPVAFEEPVGNADIQPLLQASAAAALVQGEQQARAALGQLSLDYLQDEPQQQSFDRLQPLLPSTSWPDGDLRVTAIDATDGTFRVLDRNSSVPLVTAIAASCAVPGVYRSIIIDGRQHMDGGMRSGTNADVAAGYDRVLIIACAPEPPASPFGMQLPQAVEVLRTQSRVLLIEADAESTAAFGSNPLRLSTRATSAEAGYRQGLAVADSVKGLWTV